MRSITKRLLLDRLSDSDSFVCCILPISGEAEFNVGPYAKYKEKIANIFTARWRVVYMSRSRTWPFEKLIT